MQAVVTNHLVVRGSYRSLSLIIYGNTAEDLGQFNIDFDDNSLTDLVSSAEGKLEDLPLALRSISRTIEEAISSLNKLSLPVVATDISSEVKLLLHLIVKIFELPSHESVVHNVVKIMGLAASSYLTHDINKQSASSTSKESEVDLLHIIMEARKELTELHEVLKHETGNASVESLAECSLSETEAEMTSSKRLVDMLSQHYSFIGNTLSIGCEKFPQVILIYIRVVFCLVLLCVFSITLITIKKIKVLR